MLHCRMIQDVDLFISPVFLAISSTHIVFKYFILMCQAYSIDVVVLLNSVGSAGVQP